MNPEENQEKGELQAQRYPNEDHEEYDSNLLDEEVLENNQNEMSHKPHQEKHLLQIPQANLQPENYFQVEKVDHQEQIHSSRQDYQQMDYMRSENSKKNSSAKYDEEDSAKRENNFYRREDESEVKIHFYIERVYWPRNMSISNFISEVRRQICKASAPETIQVISYEGTEVTLAIGMKTDKDALAIMRGHKTIYLNDRYRKLYLTSPKPSKAFSLLWEYKRKSGGIWDHPRDYMKKDTSRLPYKRKHSEEGSRSSSKNRMKRRRSFSPQSPAHNKSRFSPHRHQSPNNNQKKPYRSRSRTFSKSRERSESYEKQHRSKNQNTNQERSFPQSERHSEPLQSLPAFVPQNSFQLIQANPIPTMKKAEPQFCCYALGLPVEFGESDLMEALKEKIADEKCKGKLELPVSVETVKDQDMEYFKLNFSNENCIDELIFNSIKVKNKYPIMILPHFEDRSVLNSVLFHEILVNADQKISAISIFQAFQQYGDIISVLEEREDTFVVIFAHRKSVKNLNLPQVFAFRLASNTAENGIFTVKISVDAVRTPRPVKRQLTRENYNHFYSNPPVTQYPPNTNSQSQSQSQSQFQSGSQVQQPPQQSHQSFQDSKPRTYSQGGNSGGYSNYRENNGNFN